MFGSLLLSLLILPSTLPQFTISPVNRVTTYPMTTDASNYFAAASQARRETKYTFDKEFGKISCRTAETVVSNCDILELLRDDHTYIDSVQHQKGRHLVSIEERLLEVLEQLQEVCFSSVRGQLEPTASARPCTISLVPSPKSCGPQYLSAALVPGVLGGEDSSLHDQGGQGAPSEEKQGGT